MTQVVLCPGQFSAVVVLRQIDNYCSTSENVSLIQYCTRVVTKRELFKHRLEESRKAVRGFFLGTQSIFED